MVAERQVFGLIGETVATATAAQVPARRPAQVRVRSREICDILADAAVQMCAQRHRRRRRRDRWDWLFTNGHVACSGRSKLTLWGWTIGGAQASSPPGTRWRCSARRASRRLTTGRVFRCAGDEPLPWDVSHRLAGVEPDPKKTWLHVVYLGCFAMKRVVEVLEQRYGRDPESYDRRNDDESALAAFTIDEDGLLKRKSVVLSSCAWATGLVAHGERPDPRYGLEDAQAAVKELISGEPGVLVDPDADGIATFSPDPATAQDLRTVLAKVTAYLGLGTCLRPEEIRIRSLRVHRRNADEVDDFLNSFIAEDLAQVANRVRDGNYGVRCAPTSPGNGPCSAWTCENIPRFRCTPRVRRRCRWGVGPRTRSIRWR